jgi:hypothetical protein
LRAVTVTALVLPVRAESRLLEGAQRCIGSSHGCGSKPQERRSMAPRMACARREHLPPEILLLGARESQEGKVFRIRPNGKVVAALGDELKREVGAEAARYCDFNNDRTNEPWGGGAHD